MAACSNIAYFTAFLLIFTGVCCYANPIDDLNDYVDEREEKTWIQEHIWVPIVGSIVVLILIIALCTCCCCGCCACCRSNPPNVIVHSVPQAGPQITMASTTTAVSAANQNPYHAGYNQ